MNPDNKNDVDVESEGEKLKDDDRTGRSTKITFEEGSSAEGFRSIYQPTQVTRTRSLSRDTIRSNRSSMQGNAELPIEFRTLSIQISESQNAPKEVDPPKEKQLHQDYFESLDYHIISADKLCQEFNVDQRVGLSSSAAATRLQRDGKNVIAHHRENYLKKIFCRRLLHLLEASQRPPSPQNLAMAVLILIVIALQAGFSAFQDWSTARVMNSILGLLPAEAMVMRDGKLIHLPASDLVAGDIVQIAIGNKVPADMRLLTTSGDVRFDRAILTGESDEIEGAIDCTENNFLETRNIALMGTGVTNGNAIGVVILTGSNSVMGRIASMTAGVKQKKTLIQREINRFVTIIVVLTIVLVLLIVFTWLGWLKRDHPTYMSVVAMLNNAMGSVVAFIPEGVPVAVALTLMMVAKRMKKNNILPKGLATVETLGCVNVLCSDKTGTLTQNRMFVKSLGMVDWEYSLEDLSPGEFGTVDLPDGLRNMLRASVLCNDAVFDPTTMSLPVHERAVNGNATDAAVLRFGDSVGLTNPTALAPYERVHQIPFNSRNKWMLTLHRDPKSTKEFLLYVKGAPDVLLDRCATYWSATHDAIRPLDTEAREKFSNYQAKLSRRAERVIVICQRRYIPKSAPGSNDFSNEMLECGVQDLTVLGIFGIIDPPRPETASTVAACRRAGIRFFMVTGDFGLTAAAIAREIGIFDGQVEPDTIDDLKDNLDPTTMEAKVPRSRHSLLLEGPSLSSLAVDDWETVCGYEEIVFARTTPEQKLRIVTELQGRGCVVAVTGDGVNDAPALRAADVGIAVGSGSDVAIEAADLVLLDKFDSIVEAIRLGRLVFQNLQKVIAYLLPAGSWSEIWPVLMNVFFGCPAPLSTFLMIIPPPRRPTKDHLINLRIYGQSYLFVGVMETFSAHAMFFFYMWRHAGIPFSDLIFAFESYGEGFHGYTADELNHFVAVGQSVYFVTLVIMQWGNVLSVRSKRMSLLQADPIRPARRNVWLPLSILISLIIAIFVTEVPGIQNIFATASVPILFWCIPIGLAMGVLCMDELRKLLVRLFPKGPIAWASW
ncbi:ATPase P-type K/Mg/Cd/Cu/Zn/Na/Ca/Na/H-transporter [Penicillium robsamsonii]|uniref:ATPase P-type K/Mg/Cd/Cu/Zn/Na/Ca/Na/H-transporter n=1 Tax=Penicillium robsamsonii TaxID=1792511 RepID=UPI00254896CD|nr:ATPase P-type K/Mg/Cd/Cu/Zn/Na/Ca/Na/H-transporter [Penicillium robsamsonii]KAJ5817555.1 ATPase P-type K/Mg/Cd/Cu/Zn/Na/Ca/Na/H-transporter [Penicillium robsamsonii]